MVEEVVLVPQGVFTDDFESEKSLLDYIVSNIENFCSDILDDTLISFETEKSITTRRRFSPRGRRIDLYIVGRKAKYIIELKNPFNQAENRYAIGQLLDYGREFLDPKKELVLLTTKFDINTAKTIAFYDLPIRYIYFDKRRILEYKS